MPFAGARIPVLPVATKVDALSRNQRQGTLSKLARAHGFEPAMLLPFSAHEGFGKEEILDAIREIVREPKAS